MLQNSSTLLIHFAVTQLQTLKKAVDHQHIANDLFKSHITQVVSEC